MQSELQSECVCMLDVYTKGVFILFCGAVYTIRVTEDRGD